MQNKVLIFDLDATLYDVGDKIEQLCDAKVVRYFADKLKISLEQSEKLISEVRSRYAYDVEALEHDFPFSKFEFMEDVCDVDVSVLQPDPKLNELLKSLPQPKYILTDSIRRHVHDTLKAIQVDENLFSGVFDAHDMKYTFKYNPESFKLFLQKYNLNAKDCVLFEDSVTNLKTAKKLGFTTVLIRREHPADVDFDYYFPDIKTALAKLF